jgi:hypothetical protein
MTCGVNPMTYASAWVRAGAYFCVTARLAFGKGSFLNGTCSAVFSHSAPEAGNYLQSYGKKICGVTGGKTGIGSGKRTTDVSPAWCSCCRWSYCSGCQLTGEEKDKGSIVDDPPGTSIGRLRPADAGHKSQEGIRIAIVVPRLSFIAVIVVRKIECDNESTRPRP